MSTVPQPRQPVCLRHHVWMANCGECNAQRQAERKAAEKRLDRARTSR